MGIQFKKLLIRGTSATSDYTLSLYQCHTWIGSPTSVSPQLQNHSAIIYHLLLSLVHIRNISSLLRHPEKSDFKIRFIDNLASSVCIQLHLCWDPLHLIICDTSNSCSTTLLYIQSESSVEDYCTPPVQQPTKYTRIKRETRITRRVREKITMTHTSYTVHIHTTRMYDKQLRLEHG